MLPLQSVKSLFLVVPLQGGTCQAEGPYYICLLLMLSVLFWVLSSLRQCLKLFIFCIFCIFSSLTQKISIPVPGADIAPGQHCCSDLALSVDAGNRAVLVLPCMSLLRNHWLSVQVRIDFKLQLLVFKYRCWPKPSQLDRDFNCMRSLHSPASPSR